MPSAKITFLLFFLLSLPGLIYSQFYFGRNKIQYDNFEWQVLESDHFNLYYYKGEEQLAQAAVYFAEEAFNELEQKFNYTLNRSVPLVIYSNHIHFQQTNIMPYHIPEGVGGFFEFIKKRVVIPYGGNMYDFRHVIRHELVHVFTHAKISQTASNIGSWESPNFPLWFIEGLAELWSTDWDSQAEMVIRDALLYDHLLPLDSEALYRAGFLLYKEGQSFLGYIEKTYGTDHIRQLMEDFWQYESFEETISGVTDATWESLTLNWKLALKKQVAEALIYDSVIPNDPNQLTQQGINVSPVAYTDYNGERHIVYLTSRNGYSDIILQELENPDRNNVVIKGGRNAGHESLHILQTGLNINHNGILAYVAKSGRQDVIRLVDLATGKETDSFSQPELITIRSPRWDSNGDRIVFSSQNFNGIEDIYIWEIVKNIVIKLTDDIYSDTGPSFDPAGESVIFSSDRGRPDLDGGTGLFLIRLQDKSISSITNDKYKDSYPLWSKVDSNTIYFISDRSGTANVWAITAIDTGLAEQRAIRQITNFHTGIHDISTLGPDTLLASTFQEYSFQVHKIPLQSLNRPVTKDTSTVLALKQVWKAPSIDMSITKQKKPYKHDFSLDLAQTAVAYDPIYGFLGGAQLSISDLLGNRYYHFLLTNTAHSSGEFLKRFNFAVTMVDLTRRSNRAVGIFHFANDYYNPYQTFYFERTYGIRAALNYPINVFYRLEFSGTLWHSEKNFYGDDTESNLLISNFISFVHDNSLWYYTGPIDGWRLRITVGPTFNLKSNQIHNFTGLFDLRYYYRILSQLTFAQRTMIWVNDGIDIRRYFIGGSWGLRGYRINEIYGRKYIMFNQELRFPFAHSLALYFKRYAIGVAPIRGALFLDAGNAWDYNRPDLVGSMGIGIRGLFLGGLVLRLDVGRRTDFHSIDNNWFVQFFFGWDY